MSLLARLPKRVTCLPSSIRAAPLLARSYSTISVRSTSRSTPPAPAALPLPTLHRRHFLGIPGSLSQTIGQQPAPDGDGTIPVVLVADAKTIWNKFDVIVDVREKNEVDEGMIPGAVHMPLATVIAQPSRPELEGKKVLVYCRAGIRSAKAVQAMQRAGIDAVNLAGGYLAWQGDQ